MNWKKRIDKLMLDGCFDSDIDEFIDTTPGISKEKVWNYIYERVWDLDKEN